MIDFIIYLLGDMTANGLSYKLYKNPPRKIILSIIRYILTGFVAGLVSLFLISEILIENQTLRIFIFILIPIIVSSAGIPIVNKLRNKNSIKYKSLLYVKIFIFTLMIMIVRYLWAV